MGDKEDKMKSERAESRHNIVVAAEKMLDSTKRKLTALKIGDNVLLSVLKVDREPCDLQNILCHDVSKKRSEPSCCKRRCHKRLV